MNIVKIQDEHRRLHPDTHRHINQCSCEIFPKKDQHRRIHQESDRFRQAEPPTQLRQQPPKESDEVPQKSTLILKTYSQLMA
jgi:hypothetical protein